MRLHQRYTLPDLITAISKDDTFEAGFRYLPRAVTVLADFIEIDSYGEASKIRRILVGHTSLLSDPGGTRRRVWAYITSEPDDRSGLRDFGCCLSNTTDLPNNGSELVLQEPFAHAAETRNQEEQALWWAAIASVLDFYYLEKGFVQYINMTNEWLQGFKNACGRYAAFAISQDLPPSRAPSVMDQANNLGKTNMYGNLIHLVKNFLEYQKLVQRIRKDADADCDTSKAETKRLERCLRQSKEENEDTERSLETECTKVVNLSNENSLLRARNQKLELTGATKKAQEQKLEELEEEVHELRNFRQRVKGLF
ncbi:hypothetical protein N0V95_006923 [Ascochyta clinopodiicola]|nr:hypothetical protein N0V95_006923 [Ascochyta clinopodiicola]